MRTSINLGLIALAVVVGIIFLSTFSFKSEIIQMIVFFWMTAFYPVTAVYFFVFDFLYGDTERGAAKSGFRKTLFVLASVWLLVCGLIVLVVNVQSMEELSELSPWGRSLPGSVVFGSEASCLLYLTAERKMALSKDKLNDEEAEEYKMRNGYREGI